MWFALFYGAAYWYLKKCSLNDLAIVCLATFVSYQAYGWGEFVGCVLGVSKPSERSDCDMVDDIVDNLHYKDKKLTDYPVLFGWVGLSLRGLILTFIIGLAINSLPYMLSGLLMGSVYWFGGWISRHIIDDGKHGWYWSEWLYGLVLGASLCVTF